MSIENGTLKGTTRMARRLALFSAFWLVLWLAPLKAGPTTSAVETVAPASVVFDLKIPDLPVFDQDGRKLNFYSDLVKGRTVAINFIFTTCTTICPQLTMAMRKTQQQLGARVGRDIWLVSVSVDPATDVPERLHRFAAKFDVGPGWTFVTGRKTDIDRLLTALGNNGSGSDHATTVLIGNEPAGHSVRSSGFAPLLDEYKTDPRCGRSRTLDTVLIHRTLYTVLRLAGSNVDQTQWTRRTQRKATNSYLRVLGVRCVEFNPRYEDLQRALVCCRCLSLTSPAETRWCRSVPDRC